MTDERQGPLPRPAAALAGLGRRRWIIIVVVLLAAAGGGAALALLDREAPAPPSVAVPRPDTRADLDAEQATSADTETDQAATAQAPPHRDVEAAEPAAEAPPEAEPVVAREDAAADEEPAPAAQSEAPAEPTADEPSPRAAEATAERASAGEPATDEPRPASPPLRFWADSAVWGELTSWEPPAPRPEVVAEAATPVPPVDPADVGIGPFAMPVAGACFPEFAGQLPGAPRAYRNGIHEGVDFYPGWACAEIALGTPVLAIGVGRVIRADWDYEDLTVELYREMEARGFAGPDDLDIFRGRQVWVDHGGGVVARYAHLEGIAEGIAEGTPVATGHVLGYIGESGTPGALRQPGSEIHLHFELRIGDGYLGEDQGPERALALYRAAFTADP